jgi:hypothetical protein
MTKVLNKTEKEILKVLIKAREELTGYEISARVYPNQDYRIILNRKNFIYKLLGEMVKRGIVLKKNSYPVFYRINPEISSGLRTEIILYEVQCPKCNRVHWAEQFQKTKQCNCLTAKNKFLRFWLTKRRYTGNKKVIGDRKEIEVQND